MIEFTVHGVPHPQGSKVRNRYGGMREANPNTKPWRTAVAAQAAETMGETPLLIGPLELHVAFWFPRPKAHYGTGKNASVLKDAAPDFHATKPDCDKLVRAIGDALTGIVCRDDSQFSRVYASKFYGVSARASVRVYAINAGEDEA